MARPPSHSSALHEPARMAETVLTAMRELAEKSVRDQAGATNGHSDKALDGADVLHVLELQMPGRELAVRRRRRDRRVPAAQPARNSTVTRPAKNGSVAVRERPPEHLGDECQLAPPDPGEMLFRVQACGLNHLEHALSTGAMSQLSAHRAPYICGMNAAGTVIAAGERVTRFAVGDEVFGHFLAESWAWVQAPCARTPADGPHVERRPEGLDPLAAAALAEAGLTAKTILRAADLRPGETAVVIGATSSRTGAVLVALLAEAEAKVTACATPDEEDYVRSLGATDTIECRTADPLAEVLASIPDVDLLVDLVTFGEPYFITASAPHGTIVTALPGAYAPGVPRIEVTAEPGDLAGLAQRALDGRLPVEMAHV